MAAPLDMGGRPIGPVSALIARVELVLVLVSVLAMAAIMFIVVADVFLRYAMSAPLGWSYDVIGLYLVGMVFFFALSDTMQNHGHIALDVFVPFLPRWLRHGTQGIGYAASTVLIALIAWLEVSKATEALAGGDRIAGVVPLPTWVAHAVLALGMTVLAVRCTYRALSHLASIFSANDLVETPPPPVTSGHAGEHGE